MRSWSRRTDIRAVEVCVRRIPVGVLRRARIVHRGGPSARSPDSCRLQPAVLLAEVPAMWTRIRQALAPDGSSSASCSASGTVGRRSRHDLPFPGARSKCRWTACRSSACKRQDGHAFTGPKRRGTLVWLRSQSPRSAGMGSPRSDARYPRPHRSGRLETCSSGPGLPSPCRTVPPRRVVVRAWFGAVRAAVLHEGRLGLDSRVHGSRPEIASDAAVEVLPLGGSVSPARSRCSSEGRRPHGY